MDEDEEERDYHHNGGGLSGVVSLIIVIAIGIWVYNHWIRSSWQASYDNPNGPVQTMAKFKSRDACLEYIHEQGYGECGKNCKAPDTLMGPFRCDETAD